MKPIAHARQDENGQWHEHSLPEHLTEVAALAYAFAASFGGQSWAHLAGLWHDLGKYRKIQRYIRQATGFDPDAHIKGELGKAPHSTAGALLACEKFGLHGRVFAYLIASHHAGLYDWHTSGSSLQYRLQLPESRKELENSLMAGVPESILDTGGFQPNLRDIPGGPASEKQIRIGFSLWVRMLFSALVDADFLDTERFMDPERFQQRNQWPTLATLTPLFDKHMQSMATQASRSAVNQLRAEILSQCKAKAVLPSGLFSLTVPTGGGKTLSSMAFALDHARVHNKQRIIYVIPYTSIIEQTADIFRKIFGNAVVEHHSNAESAPGDETSASRLASENWDAPIIVTTNVQFFESLFAARTSRCRKLHNIVNSIVVLDEAQLLPPEFLQPVLDVLNLLTRYYGVSIVLSTATQPALATRTYFDPQRNVRGLDNVREIIDDPDRLYAALERVDVTLPADFHVRMEWPSLAQELVAQDSVLAIVNRRRDARELWQLMPAGTLHLSALMCGAHRSNIITEIKRRLKDGVPTRVISTQLVEAGVDVDFPVVYRAFAGLDSIAQAAGRCNREGRLARGKVIVFIAPKPSPRGMLLNGENASISVLHGTTGSPLTRNLFARYFGRFYYGCDLDAHDICRLLTVDDELAVSFCSAAEKFRLISDEDSAPIIVFYRGPEGNDRDIDKWVALLRQGKPERWLLRKLQRYIVNLRRNEAMRLLAQGDIEETIPGLYVQLNDLLYHPILGLEPDGNPTDTTNLIQ